MTMAWIRARLTARTLSCRARPGLAPGVALGVEELLHAWCSEVVMNAYVQDNTTLPGRYRDPL